MFYMKGIPYGFFGMEMHMVDGGIELAQEGFVRELLRAHHTMVPGLKHKGLKKQWYFPCKRRRQSSWQNQRIPKEKRMRSRRLKGVLGNYYGFRAEQDLTSST